MKCEFIAVFLIKCPILANYRAVLKAHIRDVCCEDGKWVSQPESCSVAGIKVPIVLILRVMPAWWYFR